MKTLLLFLATIIFVSCNSQKNKFDKGKLEGNIYSNHYFGLKVKVDTPWHILNMNEIKKLMSERTEMMDEAAGNGSDYQRRLQEQADMAENSKADLSKTTHIFLSLTIDTVETMPHVLISSIDLAHIQGIKSETDHLVDYVKQTKKTYETYPVEISSSEVGKEKIGEKIFYTVLLTIKAENFLAFQKKHVLKVDDKFLSIMTNYNSDISKKKCSDLLDNIEWK